MFARFDALGPQRDRELLYGQHEKSIVPTLKRSTTSDVHECSRSRCPRPNSDDKKSVHSHSRRKSERLNYDPADRRSVNYGRSLRGCP